MNPVYLAARILAVVADPRWGGGVHRDHLAEIFGLPRSDKTLGTAIAIACRRGTVALTWGYVIAIPPSASGQEASAA
jgi:hypothetical protein